MARGQAPKPASGVYSALATPRPANSIEADASTLLDYIDLVANAGVNGLVLFSATGEFVHFDVAERLRVVSLAIRRIRLPVIVNVSHSALPGALDLAEHAIDSGAEGLLIAPPYFYPYTEEQIESFYQSFAEALDQRIPLYLCDLPTFTSPITPSLARRLLCSRQFAGMVSQRRTEQATDAEMVETLRTIHQTQSVQWLTADDSAYVEDRLSGVDGIVSSLAAALPELPVAIHRTIGNSDLNRARQLSHHLEELQPWLDRFPATVGIKQIAVARRWKQNHFAIPPDATTVTALASFQGWLKDWLPGVLAECARK